MKAATLLLAALFLVAALNFVVPLAQPVKACGSNTPCTELFVVGNNCTMTPGTSCTSSSTAGLFTGDLVLLYSSTSTAAVHVHSVTDSRGDTITFLQAFTSGNRALVDNFSYFVVQGVCNSCSATFTLTMSGSSTASLMIGVWRTEANGTASKAFVTQGSGTTLGFGALALTANEMAIQVVCPPSGSATSANPFTTNQVSAGCIGTQQAAFGWFYTSVPASLSTGQNQATTNNGASDGFEVVFQKSAGVGGNCGVGILCVHDSFAWTESLFGPAFRLLRVADSFLFGDANRNVLLGILARVFDFFNFAEPVLNAFESFLVVVTGTTISTVSVTTQNLNTSLQALPSLVLLVLFLLVPAILIGGITKSFWGVAIGALMGAGAAALPQVNILPAQFLIPVVLGMILAFVVGVRRGEQ